MFSEIWCSIFNMLVVISKSYLGMSIRHWLDSTCQALINKKIMIISGRINCFYLDPWCVHDLKTMFKNHKLSFFRKEQVQVWWNVPNDTFTIYHFDMWDFGTIWNKKKMPAAKLVGWTLDWCDSAGWMFVIKGIILVSLIYITKVPKYQVLISALLYE